MSVVPRAVPRAATRRSRAAPEAAARARIPAPEVGAEEAAAVDAHAPELAAERRNLLLLLPLLLEVLDDVPARHGGSCGQIKHHALWRMYLRGTEEP
jgi:hypothetical protein